MRKNRLHIFAIFICGLLILPLLMIVALQLEQQYLFATAEERMESSLIQTISVPESKVVWRENGRELTIEGEYFDLVSWKVENGTYILTGVYDKEETAITNLLEKQAGANSSLIDLLIIGQCFSSLVSYIINYPSFLIINNTSSLFEDQYEFLYHKNILAPPRLWLINQDILF